MLPGPACSRCLARAPSHALFLLPPRFSRCPSALLCLQGFDNVNNLLFSNGYAPGLLVQIVVMKVIATSICRGSGLQASMGLEGWRLITGWGVVTSWLQAASAVQLILPAT